MLVTAGPTREHLDPVRFLTNASSGRMGYALAAEARRRGARVTLVSGPVTVAAPAGVRVVPVTTVEEMRRAVLAAARRADVVLSAAAVGDWRFERPAGRKLKKTGAPIKVTLVPTPDILAGLGLSKRRSGRGPVLVGFALETDRWLLNAADKLRRKGLDLIVANKAAALAGARTRIAVLTKGGRLFRFPPQTKGRAACSILDRVEDCL